LNPVDPVYPYGPASVSGVIKASPVDFVVTEELGFEPSGEGEHLLLQVEKTGLTTADLIRRIAADYSIQPRNIGYSGLKDRNAVTTQWLSLHLPGRAAEVSDPSGDAYRVLRAARHRAKLRRGTHKANSFRLRIREVDDCNETCLRQLDAIRGQGMANYFGRQRFGRGQDNVEQALAQLSAARMKPMRKSMLISSLRSHLFNCVLARRISQGSWRQPLDGDVFMLRGSRSIFSEPLDAALQRRYAELDISSTASLYGSGRSRLSGEALQIEQQVFSENTAITACLDRHDARLQMRPLRVAVDDLDYEFDKAHRLLELRLRLPAGSYATVLLEHFMHAVEG